MLKAGDKVYFIKSSEDNIDLPYNKELIIVHTYFSHNLAGIAAVRVIKINNDKNNNNYHTNQFISAKDYRKEKLKKLEEIMKNA